MCVNFTYICKRKLNETLKIKVMKTIINGKEFNVKQVGNRYYYWSYRALRNLPVAKKNVIFD